jgi:iron complex transport system ATP-binding protein
MIRIEQVSLVAGGRMLLDGIDLTIRAGETTVLIGPNGAGKSTLLRLISGAARPSSGRILIDGIPVERYSPARLAHRRAVLSQHHDGGESFTIEELVRLGLRRMDRRVSSTVRRALIDELLASFGLGGWNNRIVGTLSGGERQRAHLARVLVQLRADADEEPPGALLLDEPIAAQDPAQQLRVLNEAQAYAAAGGTVLIVLHDLNWAARVADRMIALKHGRVVADGSPSAIFTRSTLATVFEVELDPCSAPADRPYVLPQMARSMSDNFS